MTKADLLERISFEKEQEDSWKREFEEIYEFSRQANERYTSYLVVNKLFQNLILYLSIQILILYLSIQILILYLSIQILTLYLSIQNLILYLHVSSRISYYIIIQNLILYLSIQNLVLYLSPNTIKYIFTYHFIGKRRVLLSIRKRCHYCNQREQRVRREI